MLTLVTALLLAVLLRSIVVAGIGVVLNLLAVGATLGLLRLLFQGDAPLLGGPGEIDAVAVTAIFGVVFALSIDYQVFIVSRVREEWLRTGDAAAAVQVGLARTARVVTGAALSMLGVFFAFGLADVASLRQFGVGLAIAVIIDATLVRLVLLPAALRLAGDWAWWSPKLGFEDARPAQAPHVLAWEAPASRDQVVDERVGPDVGDLIRIPRDRDTPRLRRPADREVAQATGDEALRLVRPEAGQHEVGTLVVELEQLVLVRRQPEEPVLLLDPLRRDAVVGALAVDELVLVLEGLAADAIEPGVDVLVDVAVVVDALQEVLDEALVALIGRPDEVVDRRVDARRQLLPRDDDLVDVLLGREPLLRSYPRHLVGVLVDSREEVRLLAALPVMAHEDVGRDRRVRVADVRRRVDVVNGCGQVEAHRLS